MALSPQKRKCMDKPEESPEEKRVKSEKEEDFFPILCVPPEIIVLISEYVRHRDFPYWITSCPHIYRSVLPERHRLSDKRKHAPTGLDWEHITTIPRLLEVWPKLKKKESPDKDGTYFFSEPGRTGTRLVVSGSLDCLKYLHKKGLHMSMSLCSVAAQRGDVECLRFLYENACGVHVSACNISNSNLSRDCIHYGYSGIGRFIPPHYNEILYWNHNVCDHSIRAGSIECLQYAHQYKCTYMKEELMSVALEYSERDPNKYRPILAYISKKM